MPLSLPMRIAGALAPGWLRPWLGSIVGLSALDVGAGYVTAPYVGTRATVLFAVLFQQMAGLSGGLLFLLVALGVCGYLCVCARAWPQVTDAGPTRIKKLIYEMAISLTMAYDKYK